MKKRLRTNRVKWYKSLAFSIVIWLLPIFLIPIFLISYNRYEQSIDFLQESAYHDIKQASILEKKFINNWFFYRNIDIKNWSTTEANIDFLSELSDAFHDSNESLHSFIESDLYITTSIMMETDMIGLVKDYDYLYDLFLIDKEGNILYSVAKESDLGTNLLDAKYKKSKFTSAFLQTLDDQKIHFSDLEIYAPSHNTVAGFFTAPVFSQDGHFIGVFAIQIKLDKIYNLFEDQQISNHAFSHYLVGDDGLLRSELHNYADILKVKVDTKQFKLWKTERGNHGKLKISEEEHISKYLNPDKVEVFGLHQDIDILGVRWALISESNLNSINIIKAQIIRRSLLYLLLSVAFVIILSIFVARSIVKPIFRLSEGMMKFTNGDRNIKLDISSQGEIGELAESFQEMIHSIKKSENKLDEQKYALNAHAIVAVTDVKGTITYVNKKFIEISGYKKEELLGKNHRLLNSHNKPKEYWQAMYKSISSGKVWSDEIKNKTKEGAEYWVNTTIVPFMDKHNRVKSYIAIRTDITEKKAYEEELIKAKAITDASVQAKSEFFASMSHEIRTPMNGVIGMLGLLLNTELSDAQKHQAYLAQTSAKALLNLINDILDFSKFEAGKLELESIDFNVRKEFGDFAEAIALRAQEKGIEVVLDMTEVDTLMVRGDIGRIRQILNNIVGNAIKFTHNGYVLIKVVLIKRETKKARLKIEVSDSGIGIPKEKLSGLFDSFTQVDASTTRKYGGTGLGLAIVKKLCTIMNGSVSVESKQGEGSKFFIDIEITLSEDSPTVIPKISLQDKRALIFDKSEVSAKALSRQLQHWGMVVVIVDSKKKFNMYEQEQFEIIFIDKSEDSLTLASEIQERARFGNPKLVLMTLLKESGEEMLYLEAGFDLHYPKPATSDDILKALHLLSLEHNRRTVVDVQEHSKVIDKNWQKELKILLVDDNKVNQLVANGILEELGLEADVANNGLEALEKLRATSKVPYSIILMDCQMPLMDGYDATKAIKSGECGEIYTNIPVIAMTANAMDGDREKCFIAGMDDYLSKPIDAEKLKLMLQKYTYI